MTVEPRANGRRFSAGKQILFSVIIVVGLLGLAEGAIRLWALYFRTSYERYNSATGRLELRPNIHYTNSRGRGVPHQRQGFVGPEFDDIPGRTCIASSRSATRARLRPASGRSATRISSNGSSTAATPARRFEVINAGIEGYNSTFALARLREELLQYQPKIVIIYIGWNDLMKTDPANVASIDEHAWLAELLEHSYLVKAYKKLLFVNLRSMVLRPAGAKDARDGSTFEGFVPRRYQSNLTAMVRLLEQHRIKPVLVTLPTVVEPGMTTQELQQANVFFPYFSGAYGVSPLLSLHRAYNRAILDVGRQQGAEVVDLAAKFEPITKRTTYFWDTMHPNEKGGALIAEILAARIRTLEAEGRL